MRTKRLLPLFSLICSICARAQIGSVSMSNDAGSGINRAARDVREYGAKCDGATDDTNAIRNGINDISARGGGILQFPAGTCVLATLGTGTSKTIVQLKSNVAFQGAGRGVTTLQLSAAGTLIPISAVSNNAATSTTTVTTAIPHGFVDNQAAVLAGVALASYNGVWNPIKRTSATQFTFPQSQAGLSASRGGTVKATAYSKQGSWVYWFSTADAATQNLYGTYSNIAVRDMTFDVNARNGNRWNAAGGNRCTFYLPDVSNVTFERVDFIDTDVGNSIWIGMSTNRSRRTRNFRVADCTFDGPTSNDLAVYDMSQIVTLADNSVITGNRFLNTQAYSRGRVLTTAVELHGNDSSFTNNVIKGYRQAAFVAAEVDSNPLLTNVEIAGNKETDLNAIGVTLWADGIPAWSSAGQAGSGVYGVNQWVSNAGRVYRVSSTPGGLPVVPASSGKGAPPTSACAPISKPPIQCDANSVCWQCVPNQPIVREIRGVNIHDNTFVFQPTSGNPVDGSAAGLTSVAPTTAGNGAVGATNQVQFHRNQLVYNSPPNWAASTAYPVIGTTISGPAGLVSAGSNGPLVTIASGPAAGQVFRAVPPHGRSASSGNGPTGCPLSNLVRRGGNTVTATCLAPYTHGYTAGVSVVDINYTSATGDPNFPAGTFTIGAGGFTATQFQYRQSGSNTSLGAFSPSTASVDGTSHWVRVTSYENSNAGINTTLGCSDWTIADNVFQGFNGGVGLGNLTAVGATFNNLRIRGNRFIEGSTVPGNNAIAIGGPTSVIGNLSIEDNQIVNIATSAKAPTTPIYLHSAAGAASYRVTNNTTVGFTPQVLGGAMLTVEGATPGQIVLAGPQNFAQSYTTDPALTPDLTHFSAFNLTFTGAGGVSATISNPVLGYQGQQMKIEFVNNSSGPVTPTFGSNYRPTGTQRPLSASRARTYLFQARASGSNPKMDQVSVSTDRVL